MATLSELMAFLEARLALPPSASGNEVPLLWRPANTDRDRPLRRIGLALEFSRGGKTEAADCDALFLHRPFQFPPDALPGIPVLASHAGFDAHLTTGYNPALATALGLQNIAPLFRGDRPGEVVPIGMIGTVDPPQTLKAWTEKVTQEFRGLDVSVLQDTGASVRRAVVMNALNPAMVVLASEQGATVYLTGQMRENARPAADLQGMSLLAAGHERIERWGLRRLAAETAMAFPELNVHLLQA